MNTLDRHMIDASCAAAAPTFLIVVREVLVGHDIAQAITDALPTSGIIATASLDDAAALVEGVVHLAVAFVAAGPAEFGGSALAPVIAGRGGSVVLMGPGAESSPGVWPVLRYPFSTEAIEAHLAPFARNRDRD